MPVIFVIFLVYNFSVQNGGIKCYVIFFSIIQIGRLEGTFRLTAYFICEVFLDLIHIFLVFLYSYGSCSKSDSLNSRKVASSSKTSQGFKNKGNRCYSTYKGSAGSNKNLATKSKTLTSPKSRAYEDLYAGRAIPKNESIWVKDNGLERSPFGASWAKNEKDRLPLPSNYPCNYVNISDPSFFFF